MNRRENNVYICGHLKNPCVKGFEKIVVKENIVFLVSYVFIIPKKINEAIVFIKYF
jgi:hypothetical protein